MGRAGLNIQEMSEPARLASQIAHSVSERRTGGAQQDGNADEDIWHTIRRHRGAEGEFTMLIGAAVKARCSKLRLSTRRR